MKILNKAFLFCLMAAMIFASCEETNLDETNITDPNYQPDETEVNILFNAVVMNTTSASLDLGCISIDMPFDLVLTSGATVTISTVADFDTAVADAADPVIDFVFPVNITDTDGNSLTINDNNELGIAFASCIPDAGWDDSVVSGDIIPAFIFQDICLDLVYPVSMEDSAGNVYTAADESQLINLIASVNDLFFSLPMDLLDDAGNTITVNDMDGFYTAAYDCGNVNPPSIGNTPDTTLADCFNLVYPYDVMLDDGTVVTIADDNDYANVVLNGGDVEIQYPFYLLDTDGTTIQISTEGDLIVALQDCIGIVIVFPSDPCESTPAHVLIFFNQSFCGYVDYPVQLSTTSDALVHDINDMDDYYAVYNAYQWDDIDFVYPFSVTESDGTVTSFIDEDAVCTFISNCN